MYKVTFVQPDGASQTVEAYEGQSVMKVALDGLVRGIIGECGGELSCATCHVYVNRDWLLATLERTDDELDMLETTAEEPTECSRLSCQLKMSAPLDGLVVEVPATQR